MKMTRKTIVILLLALFVAGSLFAGDVENPTDEKFRIEVSATGALNTNILVTSLPYANATLKLSTMNNNLGILGGVEYYNDLWYTDGISFFQRYNYIAGVSLYNHNIIGGINYDPESGDISFGSVHVDYSKDVWQAKQGALIESVAVRFGIDCYPSIPNLGEAETWEEGVGNGFAGVFLILFSLIPRPSIGVTLKLGAGF